MDPRIAARAMVAVVLVAVAVCGASFLQTPTYESSAQVLVAQKQGDQQMELANQAGSGEMIKTLPPKGPELQALILELPYAIDSRPVAEKAIGRLGLQTGAAELLDNLTVESLENTRFIVLIYESTDPVEATKIVNTVGNVSSELISERSSTFTATVYEKAAVPESPVSPHPLRNGLLTLVIGLVLCAGTVVARPGVGARVAGLHGGPSEAERIKEQELLQALDRRGKLTAVEAALETSLSVEEANRMLFELAARGHPEVTVEHGKLLYSFWGEHEA